VTDTCTVLFICAHSAHRSQIAAGYLQHLAGDRLTVLSAGPEPSATLAPAAVDAMAEEGIDISGAVPAPLTAEVVESADVVVTLDCPDARPSLPHKRYEDWQLDTPPGQGIEAARCIRDQVKIHVTRLAGDLLAAAELGDEPA
jgi:protein-tyrosine-phosphatase